MRRGALRQRPLWVISGNGVTSASCPLFPSKRTFVSASGTSAMCQKRTLQKLSASDVRADWLRAIIPSHVIAIWLSPIE